MAALRKAAREALALAGVRRAEAVTLGAVELALADAERRLLPGPTLA